MNPYSASRLHAHRHAHLLVEEGLRGYLARVDADRRARRLLEEAAAVDEDLRARAAAQVRRHVREVFGREAYMKLK